MYYLLLGQKSTGVFWRKKIKASSSGEVKGKSVALPFPASRGQLPSLDCTFKTHLQNVSQAWPRRAGGLQRAENMKLQAWSSYRPVTAVAAGKRHSVRSRGAPLWLTFHLRPAEGGGGGAGGGGDKGGSQGGGSSGCSGRAGRRQSLSSGSVKPKEMRPTPTFASIFASPLWYASPASRL